MESFDLSWAPVSSANSYNIYRSQSLITSINNSVTFIGNTISTEATDTIITNGTYYYAITAVGPIGESSPLNSQSISVAIPPPIIVIPGALVLNLIPGNPSSSGYITLSWTTIPGAVSYNLYRYTSMITSLNSSVTYLGMNGLDSCGKYNFE